MISIGALADALWWRLRAPAATWVSSLGAVGATSQRRWSIIPIEACLVASGTRLRSRLRPHRAQLGGAVGATSPKRCYDFDHARWSGAVAGFRWGADWFAGHKVHLGSCSTNELPSKDAVGATSLAWCLGRALVSYAQWPQTIIVLGTIAQEHD
jgi:hypothetical protein